MGVEGGDDGAIRIFVSYRRSDEPELVYRLCDQLGREFGNGNVFVDIDSIPTGTSFADQIDGAIRSADIVIAAIGSTWIERIHEDGDFVRMEIESALRLRKPCFPVLLKDTTLPKMDALPESLRSLVHLNAQVLRGSADFITDSSNLIGDIRYLRGPSPRVGQAPANRVTTWADSVRSRRAHALTKSRADASAPGLCIALGALSLLAVIVAWLELPDLGQHTTRGSVAPSWRVWVAGSAVLSALVIVAAWRWHRSAGRMTTNSDRVLVPKSARQRMVALAQIGGGIVLAAAGVSGTPMDSVAWTFTVFVPIVAGSIQILRLEALRDAALLAGTGAIAVAMFLPSTSDSDFGIRVGVDEFRGVFVVLLAVAGFAAYWARWPAVSFVAIGVATVLTLLSDFLRGMAYVGDYVAVMSVALMLVACAMGATASVETTSAQDDL